MRKIALPLQSRSAEFAPATLNADRRTVDVIWTTGAPVKRYDEYGNRFFMEEMVVAGANLERLNAGASVLNSHGSYNLKDVIGVVERAWLNDKKTEGYATIRFSDRDDVTPIWQDVKNSIIRNVSVGYSIDDAVEVKADPKGSGLDIFRVTQFTPVEISIVPIPADARAKIRSITDFSQLFPCTLRANTMSDTETEAPPVADVTQLRREYEAAKKLGGIEAKAAERKRISELTDLFSLGAVPRDSFYTALRTRAIDEDWSVEFARAQILNAMSDQTEPAFDHSSVSDYDLGMSRSQSSPPPPPAGLSHRGGSVRVVRDSTETAAESIEQVLMHRMGLIESSKELDRELAERGFAGLALVEMGRQFFRVAGQEDRTRGQDKFGMAKLMLTRGGAGPMTHSDFPYILANVATKIAQKGFAEAATTWREWCNTDNLPNFQTATIAGLGAFTDLDPIPKAGGPYQFGVIGEIGETATLGTYGKLFGISRVAIADDNLMEFRRIGLAMGGAAARKLNSLAYTVLTGNQTMGYDSTALFHANHGNYVAQGSGAAPSVTTLNAVEVAMMLQTAPVASGDSTDAYLNVAPGHLIVPPSLKATSNLLNTNTYDPAGTTAAVSRRDSENPWRGRLTVTADAALGGSAATGWYMAAPKGGNVDTVTVFFLEGSNGLPYTEEREGFEYDGITYKVRIDAVARALWHGGLYFNYGA